MMSKQLSWGHNEVAPPFISLRTISNKNIFYKHRFRMKGFSMVTRALIIITLLCISNMQACEKEEIYDTYEITEFKSYDVETNEVYDAYEVPAYKSADLKEVKLLHRNNSFSTFDEGKIKRINPCRVDKDVRSISTKNLKAMLKKGYLSFHQLENGEFTVQAQGRVEGGGALGATIGAIFGKALVHFVGHGTIYIISLCTGPACLVTATSLEAALLPTVIMPLSTAAAIGFGVLGGVATGPV